MLALDVSVDSYLRDPRLGVEMPTRWQVRERAEVYSVDAAADEQLSDLGEEIMTLSARISAETHRLLELIAEFDRRRGWEVYGFGSCAEWLAHATRLDKVTARERVRVARALAGLPETSAAMARGELSYSQVRAIAQRDAEQGGRPVFYSPRGVRIPDVPPPLRAGRPTWRSRSTSAPWTR